MSASPASSNDCFSAIPKDAQCVACGSTERVSLHYNALSCHGCKAFFRRTVFERRKYHCSAEGNCDITDENRNQCRACRFQKCVRGGMNPKHVREERAKRRLNEHSEQELDTRIVDEHPLTCRLVELERQFENGIREGDEERDLLRRKIIREFNIPEMNITKVMNYNCDRVMNDIDLIDSFYLAFLLLSEWAGDLPEFRLLPQSDQMLLFRQNFMVFAWLHFTYRTYTTRQEKIGVAFGNGSYIPYSEEAKRLLDPKWSDTYALLGAKLIETIVEPMIELQFDCEEYVILKTMALFLPDNQLSNEGRRITAQMREVLTKALSIHIERRFPLLNHLQKSQRCMNLTLLIPPLMAAGQLEATFVQRITQEPSFFQVDLSQGFLQSYPIHPTLENVQAFLDTKH